MNTLIITNLLMMPALFAADDAMTRERLEKMLTDGDTAWIVQTFTRHADNTLGFIDGYFEGGLKMIEEGGSEKKATEMFRKGLEFARLADKAYNEVIFTQYAASFGSWSPKERLEFRQGQQEFRAGRKIKDNPEEALAHFEKSLALASPLGDAWGSAMAHTGIATTKLKLKDYEGARDAAMKAAEFNGRLRLRRDHIRSRLIIGQSYVDMGNTAAGRGHLRIAWDAVTSADTPALRTEVLDAYCTALEAAGAVAKAAELRAEFAKSLPAPVEKK